MSAVPASPEQPGLVLERVGHLAGGQAGAAPGATAAGPGRPSPERVAITRPSSGVKPIVVSTERPSSTAHSEAPGAEVAGHDPARTGRELPRAAGGVGVREAVEAEPAHPVALPPFARQRVGGRRRRERGVEGGVEARDLRHVRQRPRDGVDGRQRLRLVKRRERGQLAQRRQHLVVEPDGRAEALAAVHDAVPDRVRRLGQLGERLRDRLGSTTDAERRARAPQLGVVGVEQRQLEAARPGVGDEDAHAQLAGQVQSRTSGESSPCSRV